MEVFSDNFGRKIWFRVAEDTLHIDLQDISESFEYERSATVIGLSELYRILNFNATNLEIVLCEKFGSKAESFDLLCDFLTQNNIQYGYYSGMR